MHIDVNRYVIDREFNVSNLSMEVRNVGESDGYKRIIFKGLLADAVINIGSEMKAKGNQYEIPFINVNGAIEFIVPKENFEYYGIKIVSLVFDIVMKLDMKQHEDNTMTLARYTKDTQLSEVGVEVKYDVNDIMDKLALAHNFCMSQILQWTLSIARKNKK